jgi:hypothetical protein
MENNDNFGEGSNFEVRSMDDIMSNGEKILAELLYTERPVKSREIAEKTGTDAEQVGKIAMSLINAGYLLTDSRNPGLDETASFYPDPIVSKSIKRAKTFRAADSKEEIKQSITEYEEVLAGLKQETGFNSGQSYNEAVFDSDSDIVDSRQNKDKALKWIVLEGQLKTLKQVADEYETFEQDEEFLDEEFEFNSESINPPSIEKEKHLEPVLSAPI